MISFNNLLCLLSIHIWYMEIFFWYGNSKFVCLAIGSFAKDHEFVKPNDERALNLMNSCAVAVATEFQDIVFSYGVSDEYRCLFVSFC